MVVLVDFVFMTGMIMVVLAMFSLVVMVMNRGIDLVIMVVFMLMEMLVGMTVTVLMAVAAAIVTVLVLMLMDMFVTVQMLMLVFAFHGRPPCRLRFFSSVVRSETSAWPLPRGPGPSQAGTLISLIINKNNLGEKDVKLQTRQDLRTEKDRRCSSRQKRGTEELLHRRWRLGRKVLRFLVSYHNSPAISSCQCFSDYFETQFIQFRRYRSSIFETPPIGSRRLP